MLLGPLTQRVKNIHMIGIGGSGMSGIAEILVNVGFTVTGSDLRATPVTERLESLGARVFIGHSQENVADCDVVVYSYSNSVSKKGGKLTNWAVIVVGSSKIV